MYIDHTRPPFIDITLPPATILPSYQLVLLYSSVLLLDYTLLHNERRLYQYISSKQVRFMMTIYHIAIPMIFISNSQPLNILFTSTPWFLASYSAHMPTDSFSLKNWSDAMVAITKEDNTDEQYTINKRRVKGAATIALGVFKLAFCHLFINPMLPHHPEDALEYAWMHPLSLIYTILFGVKAYCLLGVMEIFLGLQQLVFGWKMVDLNNYPILSNSPRDFWSRRWNKIIRNLLHSQVFAPSTTEIDNNKEQLITPPITPDIEAETTKKKSQRRTKRSSTTTATRRLTRSVTRAAAASASASSAEEPTDDELLKKTIKKITKDENDVILAKSISPVTYESFWSTRRGRGLLAFIVSGIFHELIIMCTCRKITLENLAFFTIEGLLVMLEVDLRQGVYKQEPTGETRLICIILQLLHLSIVGRLFTGPFLRYKFLS